MPRKMVHGGWPPGRLTLWRARRGRARNPRHERKPCGAVGWGRTVEEHRDRRCVAHPSVAVGQQPSCWEADLTWRGAGGGGRDLPAACLSQCHEERAGGEGCQTISYSVAGGSGASSHGPWLRPRRSHNHRTNTCRRTLICYAPLPCKP